MTSHACTLPTPDLRDRMKEIRTRLLPLVRTKRSIAGGFSFGLARTEANVKEAEAFVAFEQECCAFADFAVRIEGEFVWVEITGPEDAQPVLREMAEEFRPQPRGRLMRAGVVGALGGIFALLCCATPALAIGLGAIGLGGQAASIGPWFDVVGRALIAISGAMMVRAWRHRRSAGCGC